MAEHVGKIVLEEDDRLGVIPLIELTVDGTSLDLGEDILVQSSTDYIQRISFIRPSGPVSPPDCADVDLPRDRDFQANEKVYKIV